jgi:REP element-mobilizing transposase RayT
MPQSFASLNVHIIFSTKHRLPLLTPDLRSDLFAYWTEEVRAHRSMLLAVGGVLDHVHLLVSPSREIAVAAFVRDIKAASSRWLHETKRGNPEFAWQNGYGAFSVSHSQLAVVKDYIATQEQHHAGVSYQDEFRAFLRRHDIPFDERYIWE